MLVVNADNNASSSQAREPAERNGHRREILIQSAREEFSKHGFVGASVASIAARAGIRKSTLFHHFQTKDELYDVAVRSLLREMASSMNAAVDTKAPFADQLESLLNAMQRFFAVHPSAARLLMRGLVEGEPGSGAPGTETGPVCEQVVAMTTSILASGMEEGAVRAQSARHLALSVLGAQCLCFAAPEVSSRLLGADVFGPEQVRQRMESASEHVRRLIGVRDTLQKLAAHAEDKRAPTTPR